MFSMANRRCFQTLTRCLQSIKALTPLSETLAPHFAPALNQRLAATPPNYTFINNFNVYQRAAVSSRNFSSKPTDSDEDEDDEDDDDEEDYESGEEGENENEIENEGESVILTAEEKEKEASEIGYKVIGPLKESDRVFKAYEPVFAVVQIGSHQFKVSNGDSIFVEKLKHCDVNDKLVLNKVLLLGSATQSIIGRPILPDAAVHAVVEEHALDAKVIIFKKKRRKNYRRKNGHRQELTKLRITDIQGIEKPNPPKRIKKKAEKVDVQGTKKPENTTPLRKEKKKTEVAVEA